MTTLGKLIRTTAFKLSVIYLAAFTAFAVVLVGYIGYNTEKMLRRQISETVEAEVKGLGEQYRRGGIRRLVQIVDRRARQPGANLYLVTDFSGEVLTGNIAELVDSMPGDPNVPMQLVHYLRQGGDETPREAMVRVFLLPGGFHVLIGRDVSESKRFREVIDAALRMTIATVGLLAILSWLFIGHRVLRRIDAVSETSRRIMEGDLSRRLQVTGSGDEIDRLAQSVNAMLERIELLMYGLKDVSDNIAHDLKTPLTRLRNRVEAALRQPPTAENYRAALEATIEDSDQMIRIFDALLKIARIEAGSPDQGLEPVDACAIARDVCELYEPVAEEAGVAFRASIEGEAPVLGSRELIAQAVANLVDNALKYGRADNGDPPRIELRVERQAAEVAIVVADNGPGIAPDDRERVRRRFVRLEASRTAPGSGLGLSLVQAVARLHRGRLELGDNEPGLAVTLFLPGTEKAGDEKMQRTDSRAGGAA